MSKEKHMTFTSDHGVETHQDALNRAQPVITGDIPFNIFEFGSQYSQSHNSGGETG